MQWFKSEFSFLSLCCVAVVVWVYPVLTLFSEQAKKMGPWKHKTHFKKLSCTWFKPEFGPKAWLCWFGSVPLMCSSGVRSRLNTKYTTIYKTENQWGPAVEHRALYSVLWGHLNGKQIQKGGNIFICMADWFFCAVETQHCKATILQ